PRPSVNAAGTAEAARRLRRVAASEAVPPPRHCVPGTGCAATRARARGCGGGSVRRWVNLLDAAASARAPRTLLPRPASHTLPRPMPGHTQDLHGNPAGPGARQPAPRPGTPGPGARRRAQRGRLRTLLAAMSTILPTPPRSTILVDAVAKPRRSEEHTSELQS